jgi:hypothetical protein
MRQYRSRPAQPRQETMTVAVCNVSPELRELWRIEAERQRISMSELGRNMMAAGLRAEASLADSSVTCKSVIRR